MSTGSWESLGARRARRCGLCGEKRTCMLLQPYPYYAWKNRNLNLCLWCIVDLLYYGISGRRREKK